MAIFFESSHATSHTAYIQRRACSRPLRWPRELVNRRNRANPAEHAADRLGDAKDRAVRAVDEETDEK